MNANAPWLSAVLVFVAVALATVAVAVLVEWIGAMRRRRAVASQLQRLDTEGLESIAPGAGSIFRTQASGEAAWIETVAARLPHLRDAKHMLQQAGLGWTVQAYLVFMAGGAVAAGMMAFLITGGGLIPVVAAAAGGLAPYMFVRNRRSSRLAKFEEQFPESIDLLGRAIRAGHPISSGLKMVAEEMPDPVSSEFLMMFEEQRFGLSFADSLASFADRMPLVDVRIFVTAVLIQREVGGNLTEILDNLAHIVRQRFQLQRQVKVLTAEGRFSMYVLSALPLAIAGFIFVSNPDYLRPLWETEPGRKMLWGALIAQGIGYMWMRRITNIEF
ncbi:MAG TPA: type II secretion system F family protein [Longimicrobiales bacterium]|nr:type II secretion system F family protein [Longimicrobiales bacterium]